MSPVVMPAFSPADAIGSAATILRGLGYTAHAAQLEQARAALSELVTECQSVVDGSEDDLHYLRCALVRAGGAA